MKRLIKLLAVAGSAILASTPALADDDIAKALAGGDAAKGKIVFNKCMACHRIGPGAANNVGPVLTGVVGRKTGTAEGYSYSKLNLAVGTTGHIWTPEHIFAYLEDPNSYLKKVLTDAGKADEAVGATKMTFKLVDPVDRADVIAYLKTFSPAQ